MKTLPLIAIIVISLYGCNQENTNVPQTAAVVPVYSITDIFGMAKTTFHSGEPFVLSFSVTNTTVDTLTYYMIIPMVAFRIFGNDTIVTSSYYGCTEPNIAVGKGWLARGQSIKFSWKAPTSPCDTQNLVLTPGSYQAQVSFPAFQQVKVNPVSAINITVVP